jgi:CTP synthase (UTP-ammonia lyase)
MSAKVRIGLVGDYSKSVKAHLAIPGALDLAGRVVNCEVVPTWLHTSELGPDAGAQLSKFDGIWCVPGSPYANMEGALAAIQFSRTQSRPFLGTCGGFQHALIEYARNVLGWSQADHAESNPSSAMPLVSPLSCSLVGARGRILLKPGSQAAKFYGKNETNEEYHCNFGMNQKFRPALEAGGLQFSGEDENHEPRVAELSSHSFFMAALFQPELSQSSRTAHPLVTAFVRATCQHARDRRG